MEPFKLSLDVPNANVADPVICREGDETSVSFSAHPHGGPEALWFCFRLERQRASSAPPQPLRLRLRLRNFSTLLGGSDPARFCPVFRADGGDWQRLPPGRPVEHADGRVDAEWTLAVPDRRVDVAACFPYGPNDVGSLINRLGGSWSTAQIGVSQSGRPIERLSNSPGDARRPGVYLIARQHSGETPGSWTLDGLLEALADSAEAAPLVWSVPLTNIDGVKQGDYGKDNFPYDLNRAWGSPPMRYETLCMMRDLNRWRQRCRPAVAIDFHAPGLCETSGLYCYVTEDPQRPQIRAAVDPVAAVLERSLGDMAADSFARVARYASRWTTSNFTRYCVTTLNVPAVSVEVPYSMIGQRVLTIDAYREAGRRVGQGLMTLLKTAGPAS